MFDGFEAFIESLEIPQACRIDQRLHKKQFYELARMNRAQQEQFAKPIESITWTHTLKKGTINIPLLVTDTIEYIEVAFVHVRLKEKAPAKKIAEVIHRIPYPVVLFITCEDEICVSTALKRINQSDISKLTVEAYLQTDWIDMQNPSKAAVSFLESLQVTKLSFENFYHFYRDICDRIVAYEAALLGGGFSTEETPQRKQTLDKIKSLQEEIVSLRGAMKKETQFNLKVALNIELKKANDKLNKLKGSL